MNRREHLIQAATLIGAAIILALVSNALASRARQMKLVGYYPSARVVPARAETPSPAPVTATETTAATQTVAPAPPPALPTTTQPPVTPSAKPTAISPPVAPAPARPAPPPPNTLAKFQPHEKQAYIEIFYPDVKALHDGGALFLDARRTSVYEQGHIAGSRPFSVWEADVDDKVAKLFNERPDPKDQALPIVIYCSGGDCEDSHMLAQKLWGAQFNNVYVYKDGFPDWKQRGGTVHEGTQP